MHPEALRSHSSRLEAVGDHNALIHGGSKEVGRHTWPFVGNVECFKYAGSFLVCSGCENIYVSLPCIWRTTGKRNALHPGYLLGQNQDAARLQCAGALPLDLAQQYEPLLPQGSVQAGRVVGDYGNCALSPPRKQMTGKVFGE